MRIHEDNIKVEVAGVLKSLLSSIGEDENEIVVETSLGNISEGKKRVDITLRNLKLLIEVEPDRGKALHRTGEGIDQVRSYAKEVLRNTYYDWVLCGVAWEENIEGRRQVRIRLFKLDKQGQEWLILEDGGIEEFKREIEHLYPYLKEGSLEVSSSSFRLLFSPLIAYSEKLKELIRKYERDIQPMSSAYQNALKIIYGKEDIEKEKILDLYARHTILQATAVAILTYNFRTGSNQIAGIDIIRGFGKPFSIALPFLEWFTYLDEKLRREELSQEWEKDRKILEKLAEDIYQQLIKLRWRRKTKDVFRLLYEEFIPPEDRWTFGEYYTPPWLVKFTVDKVREEVAEKIVIDPFCGSGTFIDYVFRLKVENGTDPSSAIYQVVGFDINPIAVLLARAELLLSYTSYSEKKDILPRPLVFYVNSAEVFGAKGARRGEGQGSLWILKGKKFHRWVSLYEVEDLLKVVDTSRIRRVEELKELSRIEGLLSSLLKHLHEGNLDTAQRLYDSLGDFKHAINFDELINFIEKYGDSIWTVSLMSLIAKEIVFRSMEKEKLVVVSNPPWKALDEVGGDYEKAIKSVVKLKGLNKFIIYNRSKRIRDALNKGNIASVFLSGWREKSSRIAFIIPETSAYDGRIYGAGKILTYNALGGTGTVYRIKADTFGHGEKACVVIDKGDEIYEVVPQRKGVKKDDEEVPLKEDYKGKFSNHVMEVAKYFFIKLSAYLDVEEVYVGKTSIVALSGIFEDKKSARAGLYVPDILGDRFRLDGMTDWISFYDLGIVDNMSDYVQPMIYGALVLPFYLEPIPIFYAREGKEKTIEVLENIIGSVYNESDRKKVGNLIPLVKKIGREKPTETDPDKWYVIYRDNRYFLSSVSTGRFIMHQTGIFIECSSKEQAYYYCGVLNYLVEKVKSGFLRHNFGRPLQAIIEAGLVWKGEEFQKNVAQLSQRLHERAKKIYVDFVSKWKESRKAGNPIQLRAEDLLYTLKSDEQAGSLFDELVDIIDKHTDQEKIEHAVRLLREDVERKKDRKFFGHVIVLKTKNKKLFDKRVKDFIKEEIEKGYELKSITPKQLKRYWGYELKEHEHAFEAYGTDDIKELINRYEKHLVAYWDYNEEEMVKVESKASGKRSNR